jgi:hypothetical protein
MNLRDTAGLDSEVIVNSDQINSGNLWMRRDREDGKDASEEDLGRPPSPAFRRHLGAQAILHNPGQV